MKKLLLLFVAILIIFVTYKYTYHQDKPILIVTDSYTSGLSDKKITYNFTDELKKNNPNTKFQVLSTPNFHLNDFQKAIINNEELLNTPAQHLIKEAKCIVLFLGLEEIINQTEAKISPSEIVNNLITTYQSLLDTIQEYNQHIVIVNYYQIPNSLISVINAELATLAQKEEIEIIDISELSTSTNFLTYESQLILSQKVNEFLLNSNLLDKKV